MRTSKVIGPAAFAPLVLIFCTIALSARGQGFGLYEQGACAMGRAGAGMAAPCDDGAGAFLNPAGLATEGRAVISLARAGLILRTYIHQSDRAGRTTTGGMVVPTAAVNNGTYRYYAHLFGTEDQDAGETVAWSERDA